METLFYPGLTGSQYPTSIFAGN